MPAVESGQEPAPRTIRPIAEPAEAVAAQERRPLGGEEAFFASLKPAQLSFAFGFMHFKNRNYDEAAESFYNASLEDPDSRLVKVFLGLSLFSIGEYPYAAEYLRLGLESWPEFASLPLDRAKEDMLEATAARSLADAAALETENALPFEEYLRRYSELL